MQILKYANIIAKKFLIANKKKENLFFSGLSILGLYPPINAGIQKYTRATWG